MLKNNKGITLIALVITIIVLLILAGVSIALVTGDNGLLKQATRAGAETQVAEAREMAIMDVNSLIAQYYEERYVNKQASGTNVTGDEMANAKSYVVANLGDIADTRSTYYTFDGTSKITLVPLKDDGTQVTGTFKEDNGTITWSDKTTTTGGNTSGGD